MKYLSIVFVLIFSSSAHAATFTVSNLNDSGAGSLRQAISDAGLVAGDDIINFQNGLSGSIVLVSGELIINSNISISGNSSLTITRDADAAGFRIINIISAANVSITNLTVSGGNLTVNGGQGGGIYNAGNLSLINTNIINNFAGCKNVDCRSTEGTVNGSGGGIYNAGSLSIINSSVDNNIAGCGSLTFSSCYRTMGEGGGIANTGTLTLTGSKVTNNTVLGSPGLDSAGDARGGGIYNSNTGIANLSGSAVGNNTAMASRGFGSGVYNLGNIDILSSAVLTNFAQGGGNTPSVSAGGGIFTLGNLSVINSTISDNISRARNNQFSNKGGDGIFNGGTFSDGVTTVKNSTISRNIHGDYSGSNFDDFGGGIKGTVIISNTVVVMNVSYGHQSDVTGTATSEGYNLIGKVGNSTGWIATDILNKDAKLAPLADNGGPTLTNALLADSPALNAGNNADAPATDQRGFARIIGGIIDIGAFESNTPCAFTINPTNQSVSNTGADITVNVAAVTGCSRTVISNVGWITITSGSNGNGNGTFTLSPSEANKHNAILRMEKLAKAV